MAVDGTTDQSAVPWDRLRAWIDEQEAWEREHKRPAPLTQAQRTAIASLLPPVTEPDIGDRDYVSELCQYAQAKHVDLPTFEYESVSKNAVHPLRWRCACKFPLCGGVFPQAGHGYAAGEEPPSFSSKKQAKQFAAKQVLEFLRGSVAAPIPESSPQTSRPQKRVKVEEETTSSEDDNGPSVLENVAILATKLGFECPTYRTMPDGDRPNFWKGQPYFRQDARIPEDLGTVQGIFGKKKAKQEMAEQVLAWLREEDRARQATTARLLATLDSKVNEN